MADVTAYDKLDKVLAEHKSWAVVGCVPDERLKVKVDFLVKAKRMNLSNLVDFLLAPDADTCARKSKYKAIRGFANGHIVKSSVLSAEDKNRLGIYSDLHLTKEEKIYIEDKVDDAFVSRTKYLTAVFDKHRGCEYMLDAQRERLRVAYDFVNSIKKKSISDLFADISDRAYEAGGVILNKSGLSNFISHKQPVFFEAASDTVIEELNAHVDQHLTDHEKALLSSLFEVPVPVEFETLDR